MTKIKLLKSILNLDGWNIPVNVGEWGTCRLSESELEEFNIIYEQVLELSKQYTIEPIFETIDDHVIEVGEIHYVTPEILDHPIKQEWNKYGLKMKNDPAIIIWNWEEIIT